MFGLPARSSNIDKRDAHRFCNSQSPTTSASDAEKPIVDHAVVYFVIIVFQLASDTPLFVRASIQLSSA
jgi:hypothetical protein